MIQSMVRLQKPTTPCQGCNGQPHAYHVRGAGKFFFECSPCGIRTLRFDTLADANSAWTGRRQIERVPRVLRSVG